MTDDASLYQWLSARLANGVTPSDRDIQITFKMRSTDDALKALTRLKTAGLIAFYHIGNVRKIDDIVKNPPINVEPQIAPARARRMLPGTNSQAQIVKPLTPSTEPDKREIGGVLCFSVASDIKDWLHKNCLSDECARSIDDFAKIIFTEGLVLRLHKQRAGQ